MSVVPDAQEHNEPTSRAQLPPSARSRIVAGLTAAAARGRFELQVCQNCGATQYPPREACHQCLSVALEWKLQSGRGELLSQTTLFHSHHEFFRERLPWRVGIIKLDCGAIVIAHLCADVQDAPSRVRVDARRMQEVLQDNFHALIRQIANEGVGFKHKPGEIDPSCILLVCKIRDPR